MTLAVQISHKTPAGKIFVIGGNNIDELKVNLLALYSGEGDDPQAAEQAAEELLSEMAQVLSPMGAGVAAVTATFPGSQVMPQQQAYGPQGPPQPHYGGMGGGGTVLRIPWNDKAYADPYLAPLKAARQARWDKENKAWVLSPGVPVPPELSRWVSG